MKSPVIVVGTGRCGSSFVARVLEERLGIDMGGPGVQRASNPGGDWEDEEVRAINEAYEGGDIGPAEWRHELKELERTEPWGFKHPGCAKYLHELLFVFRKSPVIWVQRDPDDTAESWSKWYGRSVESCMNSIKRRLRALNWTLERYPHLVIDCTERRDEDEVAQELADYLGVDEILPSTEEIWEGKNGAS